ncbi:hypothetical protein [Gemmiger formicilis]|uniref:hypothetical protein n=1 Tax=Gemmiger formicilis TaxID=745368 RepID=UPI00399A4DF7
MKFVKSIFTVCSYRVYLHFDHHLTTTVQAAPQNVGKEAVAQGKNPSAAASLRLNASRSTKTLAIDPLISKKQITQSGPSE